jgi:hypothetical protein
LHDENLIPRSDSIINQEKGTAPEEENKNIRNKEGKATNSLFREGENAVDEPLQHNLRFKAKFQAVEREEKRRDERERKRKRKERKRLDFTGGGGGKGKKFVHEDPSII